jgi:hypothetical protein
MLPLLFTTGETKKQEKKMKNSHRQQNKGDKKRADADMRLYQDADASECYAKILERIAGEKTANIFRQQTKAVRSMNQET